MRRCLVEETRSKRAADRCLDLGVSYRLHTGLTGLCVIYVGLVACLDQDLADTEIDRLAAGGEPGVPSAVADEKEAS